VPPNTRRWPTAITIVSGLAMPPPPECHQASFLRHPHQHQEDDGRAATCRPDHDKYRRPARNITPTMSMTVTAVPRSAPRDEAGRAAYDDRDARQRVADLVDPVRMRRSSTSAVNITQASFWRTPTAESADRSPRASWPR
jgi:hypothetical protein